MLLPLLRRLKKRLQLLLQRRSRKMSLLPNNWLHKRQLRRHKLKPKLKRRLRQKSKKKKLRQKRIQIQLRALRLNNRILKKGRMEKLMKEMTQVALLESRSKIAMLGLKEMAKKIRKIRKRSDLVRMKTNT